MADFPPDSELPVVPLPKESDFPPGTKFFVKEGDRPFVEYPGPEDFADRIFSFNEGKRSKFPTSTNLSTAGWPDGVPFDRFLRAIRMSWLP